MNKNFSIDEKFWQNAISKTENNDNSMIFNEIIITNKILKV